MSVSNLWSCLCAKSRIRMYVFHVKHSMGYAVTIGAQPQKREGVDEASCRGGCGAALGGGSILDSLHKSESVSELKRMIICF